MAPNTNNGPRPAPQDTIDLLELAKVLWQNILFIALAAVLAGSAAFGYTAFMMEPEYQATAAMYANNSSFSLGDSFSLSSSELSTSNSLVPVYTYILRSRTTLEDVIREADLPYSPADLNSMISTQSVSNTAAFEVTVTSTNPAETELIANTIAKLLPQRISEIVDGTSVRIVDYAIIPARRSGPDLMKNTAMGILAGGALGAALVVLFFLLNDKSKAVIQSSDELRAMYSDLMVLAQIPDLRGSEKGKYYSSYYYYGDGKKKEGKKHGKR